MFWPGRTTEVTETRQKCRSCDNYATSPSNLPPHEPIVPSYLFQHICADHLDHAGYSYGIIVNRFSNWFKVYEGKGGAIVFVNIRESCTTERALQYTAEVTLLQAVRHQASAVLRRESTRQLQSGDFSQDS